MIPVPCRSLHLGSVFAKAFTKLADINPGP
jgi:hypothetical protein